MSETDFAAFERKEAGDRTVMHVLYAMHTLAPFTAWTLAVIAMIVNYIKRGDELDAVYAAHHNYMISTCWWSLLMLIPAGIASFVLFATIILFWLAWVPPALVGLWYLYRCIRGWLRFTDGRPPY
ncbi:DUF4870 family protein [Ramlibacter humi]|uniref:DUF4870 domain-containing protein n=1 Tax=Ramlibacter humi TaxID=2530451 RepID=A0A4Z0BI13_9BURK|nr:hypothetical protein [Ramlibacter humi]TFY98965.1 hypothetical protein EZ216_15480 [Ramlibacter humi]